MPWPPEARYVPRELSAVLVQKPGGRRAGLEENTDLET